MNWKRIWTGTLIAGVVMIAIDGALLATQYFLFHWFGGVTLSSALLGSIRYFIDGFFCIWLYAVMRPRLGPGPKTALITGTALFFIKQDPLVFTTGLGSLWNLMLWVKLLAGSYLAGWQYIEKAP